jgi:hypothetical protein
LSGEKLTAIDVTPVVCD